MRQGKLFPLLDGRLIPNKLIIPFLPWQILAKFQWIFSIPTIYDCILLAHLRLGEEPLRFRRLPLEVARARLGQVLIP